MKKHGAKYYLQSEKGKEKQRNTIKEKYGKDIENISQIEEVKNKKRQTCLKHFGVENPSQDESVKRKKIETCKKHYGVEYFSQLEIEKQKSREKLIGMVENGKWNISSKSQRYLCELLKGELNKSIAKGTVVDIIKDNYAIEYDGSGHWYAVIRKKNKITLEEFNKKEKEREKRILSKGYKLIRIINANAKNADKLPSDEFILNTMESIKNELNIQNKNIARWNLEDNSIIYE
jgi:hypothetical protein